MSCGSAFRRVKIISRVLLWVCKATIYRSETTIDNIAFIAFSPLDGENFLAVCVVSSTPGSALIMAIVARFDRQQKEISFHRESMKIKDRKMQEINIFANGMFPAWENRNCSPSFGEAVADKKQVISIVSIFESKMALLASLNNCFAPVTKIAIVIDM